MYLNRLTLIGFTGGDAETKTSNSGVTFTVLAVAMKRSWKNADNEMGVADRMAPLHRFRKTRRICRQPEEGRARPGRGRTAQPRVRQGRREAHSLRMPTRIDPELDRAARRDEPENGDDPDA
jgi:hypothetical protein